VHWAFYLLLIAIPLAGWAGSSATGIDVMIADRWVVPPLVAASVEGEEFWFRLHDILTKVLIGLIVLHMLAALKREMEGDGTLTRMLRGRVR
jgi:cytochrome b561